MKTALFIELIALVLILTLLQISCKRSSEKEITSIDTAFNETIIQRTKYSSIYEVNIRQYTVEGTFKALESHIPRLKDLGVDILWLMPINPIGEKSRKGTKGSYYSVRDYYAVNPEYGSEKELKELIKTIHDKGMLVILDWVANHTSWDHKWINEHPDWYSKDSSGKIIAPVADWTDVADLNYDNNELRKEMINAMKYWVQEFDIDGYRCDVAGMVPVDFWDSVTIELEKIKPVFMLAEAEQSNLHKKAFHANYAWNFHHIINAIAKGEKCAKDLSKFFKSDIKKFHPRVYRMNFTSNHDENSWNGTEFERMPDSYKTFAVLTYLVPGMPLIYSGQEAGLSKRLSFFEKDTIQWQEHEMFEIYKKLNTLKKENNALWNGMLGGTVEILKTNKPKNILAFKRSKENNSIYSFFNLSKEKVKFSISDSLTQLNLVDYFTNAKLGRDSIHFEPWQYFVAVKNNIEKD